MIRIFTNMSIRTTKSSKGQVLSDRSPVATLLNSEFQAAVKWLAQRKDKDGNRIGKIAKLEAVVKYGKDCFGVFAKTISGKSVSLHDARGDAIFIRRLADGRLFMADFFVFCLGAGEYVLADWGAVVTSINLLVHDHGSVIYNDCWRLNKDKFISLLKETLLISSK